MCEINRRETLEGKIVQLEKNYTSTNSSTKIAGTKKSRMENLN